METEEITATSKNQTSRAIEVETFNKKVRDFLEKELPPTEERISKPMNKNCEVAVIVPVYAERNGLFSRTLLSLSEQEGITPDKFEVICVVNNGISSPDKVREENSATLSMIKYIETGDQADLPKDITDQEKKILEKIRSSGIRIYAIDKSTGEKSFSDTEANVGSARQRGLAEAVERFTKARQGYDGIIAHTDGDTLLDRQYIASLIETFNKSEIVGITGRVAMELDEASVEGFSEETRRKLYEAQDRRREYYLILAKKYPQSEVVKRTSEAEEGLAFNGCNMASRISAAVEVGGIDKLPGEEDTRFGRKLRRVGEIAYAPEVIVYSQMRFSQRTTTGYGQELIQSVNDLQMYGDLLVENPEKIKFLEGLREKINQALQSRSLTRDKLDSWLNIQGKTLLSQDEVNSFFNHLKSCKSWEELDQNNQEVARLAESLNSALQKHFPRLRTSEALKILKELEEVNKMQ